MQLPPKKQRLEIERGLRPKPRAYCEELNLRVTSKSPEELHAQMLSLQT